MPIGRYIADFAAPSVNLIVEVDGACHQQRKAADARRDRDLRRLGYTVLHLEAGLIMQQLPLALHALRAAVSVARGG
ncbi:MAG: DUF559 domain-containing protein [Polyangiaceae bacterium]